MPTDRHIPKRLLPGVTLALLLILGPAVAVEAADKQPAAPDVPAPGWFARQLDRFRSYPHLDMAYRHIREGKTGEAAKEFERYLAIAPKDRKARADFMNLLYTMGRYAEAEKEAQTILAAAPDDPTALLTLGLCQLRLGENQAALPHLQRALELSAKDPKAHRFALLSTVEALSRLHRFQEARTLLATLPQDGGDYELQFTRGVLADASGDRNGARQAYATALAAAATDKDRLAALRALAVTTAAAGDLPAARKALTEALGIAPNASDLLRQQAVLANRAKDYAEAVRLGRQLVDREPSLANREFLATALASAKDYAGAADVLRRALTETLDTDARYRLSMHLGLLLLEANQAEAAAEVLTKAVALRREPLALLRLSRALERSGRTKEAAAALSEASALDASPETFMELATLLAKSDNPDEALQALDKALANAPAADRRARILTMKGLLQSEQGNAAAARRSLEAALAAGGEKARLSQSLGEVCLELKDYPAAITAFEQALAAGAGREAKQSLAEALVKASRPEQALPVYEELVRTAQTSEETTAAREQLANILSRLGRHAAAAAQYAALAKAGHPALWFKAGQSYAAARDTDQAVASLQAYLATVSDPTAKAETLLALATIRAGRRDYAKALAAYQEALPLADALPTDKRAELFLGLGTAALLSGQPGKAIGALNRALPLTQGSAARTGILLSLGQAYAAVGRPDEAEAALRRAAATPGASRSAVADAYAGLGHLLAKKDDLNGAESAFRQAWTRNPRDWRLPFALGQVAYKNGRYDVATTAFAASLRLHDDVRTRIALGRSDEKRGKPGLALAELAAAAPGVGALPDAERRDYFLAVGFLYAGEHRYADAVTAYRAAQAIRTDPETAVRLGRVERLDGQPQEAKRTLLAVDAAALPEDLKRLRLSELASLAEADKAYDTARGYLQDSLEHKVEADTSFRLGNVERASGHPEAAVKAYRQAVQLEDSDQNLSALGYALAETKHYDEAVTAFETVLARDPDYLSLWEDLGYAAMHACDNATSVASFKQAIDNAPLRPVDSPADREKRERDVYRMRKEITKMETHLTATAYLSYLSGDAGTIPGSGGGESVDTIRSGGGLEVAWLPPYIGFRDDRIFQAIGRVTGNLKKDTLEFERDAWQGAVGVRYKPFRPLNLNVGFERLFKIGKDAEENWLLRVMESWTDGYAVKPGEKWWNYTFFYGEYDYYTENNKRSMFYGEVRQGLTYNVRDRLLITPHLVADFRLWTPDRDESSYIEGGGGLSLKYIFNRFDYEVERSSIEFLLQYKYGTLFNKTKIRDREDRISALFLTTIITF